jgi:acyl-CoA synthetase (AMP-forming)/AMP-acid ligase II
MSLVMNALDAPGASRARVHCLSDGSRPLTLAELGRHSRQAGAWLHGLAGRAGTVAALLTASHDCLAMLFGALRSGVTLVSLPHPARGMEADEYLAQIGTMCALTGATHILCDPSLTALLSAAPLPAHGFDEWGSGLLADTPEVPGSFVQFTSGSTGSPRGIALTLDALDANLTSMYGWLEPRDGAVVCSWLPLSHDMGLIGLALYAICSVNPPWSTPTDLVLMSPESFLADPACWMRACSDYRATSTTSPPFALRLAARALRSPGAFDLSSLRSFVVGSEPVPAEGLRQFETVAREHGLSPLALCPGYGMAEAALAVAIDPTTSPWSSVRVDPEALAASKWKEVAEGGTELVSCGPPVLHTEVRTTGDLPVGELEVRSPSLLSGYVGAPSPLTDDGWLHTADLGYVRHGEVFIAGRTDDVLIVAGRNIDARALDEVVAAHPACRAGNAACVPDGSGRYVVVAEPRTADMTPVQLRSGAREIRVALASRFAAAPSAVVFIERGTLPKTPSGKVRRNHLRALWAEGKLQEVASG